MPIVKLLPEGGLQTTLGLSSELSVALGCCHSTKAVDLPGSVLLDWFAGHSSNTGASLSFDNIK